jgi:hypothetical protein
MRRKSGWLGLPAYTPTYSSGLNRSRPRSPPCANTALDGTDHRNHHAQASMIRRYIIWPNQHAQDQKLRPIIHRANVA